MITPNVDCIIITQGQTDVYGDRQWDAPKASRCVVVRLVDGVQSTTVRADSSASRGFAKEPRSEARLLFPASTAIANGDRIEVQGVSLEVTQVHPRLDVLGTLNHLEVDGKRWQG